MADKTINQLTAASQLVGTEKIAVWKGGADPTQSGTVNQILPIGITAAETTALETPVSYQHLSDEVLATSVFRFMTDAQITDVVTRAGAIDVSAAIQSAINTAKPVLYPDGLYMANNLTADNASQTHHFFGNAVIKKNANGPLITFSGQQNAVYNGRFDGNGATYTGDNIVKSAANLTLDSCSSRDAEGRAVYDSNGNGLRIMGTNGIYQTADASASGWDIVVEGTGLYCRIIGTTSSQATGGIYFNQTGAGGSHSIQACQFGKLKMVGGSAGNDVLGNRIGGVVNIEKGQVSINDNKLASASDVTLGDGSTAFSGIYWGAGNTMTSGTTLTFADGLVDCEFHGIGQLRNNGITITDNTTSVNDIYDARATYAVAWTDAGGGTNAIGAGTLQSFYTQRGRKMSIDIHLQIAADTTFGSGGNWTFSLPTNKAATSVLGKMTGIGTILDDGGNNYLCSVDLAASGTTFILRLDGAGNVTKTAPMTWTTNDRLFIHLEYEL